MIFIDRKKIIQERISRKLPEIKKQIIEAVDKALEIGGEKLKEDANNQSSKEAKERAIASILAYVISTVATSASGSNITITSEQMEQIAIVIVDVINKGEYKLGDIMEGFNG